MPDDSPSRDREESRGCSPPPSDPDARTAAAQDSGLDAPPGASFAAPGSSSGKVYAIILAGALAVGAALAFWNLDQHVLWSDEAHTALFARNLIHLGSLTAWDGTNLIGYARGKELNESLEEAVHPPLQFLAAAAGMRLFGENAWGARACFAGFGVISIGLVALWARRFLGRQFPWYLPAILLALNPAYLLFIRNCRHYALSVFFTLLLLILWSRGSRESTTEGASAPASNPARWKAGLFLTAILVSLCFVGLFFSHYLAGIAALTMLPVLMLDARFRSANHWLILGGLCTPAMLCAVLVALRGPAESIFHEYRQSIGAWAGDTSTLFWWAVRDTGAFELFAWPMLLPLALPWILPAARGNRQLGRRGCVLLLCLLTYLAVVSIASPQSVRTTWKDFDVRYLVPVIAVGSVIGAVSLKILWDTWKPAAVGTALALTMTNILYLGLWRYQNRFADGAWRVRSTLADYVLELSNPYQTTNDATREWLRDVPAGTAVLVDPFFMVYPQMFYRPDLHFCNQLASDRVVKRALREKLPDYVFPDRYRPQIYLTLPDGDGPRQLVKWVLSGEYRFAGFIPAQWPDYGRPEVPYRPFRAVEFESGVAIYVPNGKGDSAPFVQTAGAGTAPDSMAEPYVRQSPEAK